MDDGLYAAIEAAAPGAARPPELDVSPFGLEQALAAATEMGGGLAYVKTEYWGGQGEQSAVAFVDGREAMAPQRSRGGGGPINQALRRIGVVRGGDDEFDTVGLGERRSMNDYESDEELAIRAAVANTGELLGAVPYHPDEAKMPTWLVILLIAAAIGGGVFMAMVR